MTSPTLSVLTLVKNRSGHLAQLVEGLRRSLVAPDQLIVVDMSDVPVALTPTGFPSCVVRLETDGLPLAAARNLAARHACSELLLFLDVDCIPMGGLISNMKTALSHHDALICADVLYLAAEDARKGWTEEDLLTRAVAHPARNFPQNGLREESNAGLFWSLAFGLRRARFWDLGGFDERFTGYGAEDTDFGFRAKMKGLPLLFMGGPGAFHQHHDVIDPPLHYFDDILRNAGLFHDRWGIWPMHDWLHAFEAMGLIRVSAQGITRLRGPTSAEIAETKKRARARC